MNTVLNKLGDWNPQLLRELKGRLKPAGILLGIGISLVFQLLFMTASYGKLPSSQRFVQTITSLYCTGRMVQPYSTYYECLRDASGNFVINWSLWWFDVFHDLSLTGFFILVIMGVYLLISDLHREDRQGTLNFIRLSPSSTRNILTGKMLGVPIILYLAAVLALPLQIWAGLSAGIPGYLILLFDSVAIAGLHLFYSMAMLFSLATPWLNSVQPWIGSATAGISLFFFSVVSAASDYGVVNWFNLFNPVMLTPHLALGANLDEKLDQLTLMHSVWSYLGFDSHWFYLPIGVAVVGAAGFMIINYSVINYWVWKSLERCFSNPNATLLTKRDSYGLVCCFELLILGFIAQPNTIVSDPLQQRQIDISNFSFLLILNSILMMGLIAALSPHRQTLLDWSRYRREQVRKPRLRVSSTLIQDLLWGDKSPALVAIALNLVIILSAITPFLMWRLNDLFNLEQIIVGLALTGMMLLIYAAIAQVALIMRTSRRIVWSMGVVLSAVVAPFFIILVSSKIYPVAELWLFSVFPWFTLNSVSASAIVTTLIAQLGMLSLLSTWLTRHLRNVGESETKALLTGKSV
ncbi:MAG TPA: ABC transporter permease [Elainellaceae cyanobacterium]